MNQPVAVITGGTHGIGRHTAELLAADGWSVALCSRDREDAAATARELADRHGVPTLGAACDVSAPSQVRRFAYDVCARLGPPRAVVANAGVLGPVGPLHLVDLDAWAATVSIDLIGVANTFSGFGAAMVEQGAGALVTLSGGGVGGPNMATGVSAYIASKAAVVALTEVIAQELAPHGITVNAIAPGAIKTRFMDAVLQAGPAVAGGLFEHTLRQHEWPDSLERFDALLRFVIGQEAVAITGRVLSARWDNPDDLRRQPPAPESSMYRLRRIDDALFGEVDERV